MTEQNDYDMLNGKSKNLTEVPLLFMSILQTPLALRIHFHSKYIFNGLNLFFDISFPCCNRILVHSCSVAFTFKQ